MFEREIWDTLPERIIENFEIARLKQRQFIISKSHEHDLSQKSPEPNI